MAAWSLDVATDLARFTYEYIEKELALTLKESTYEVFNMLLSNTKDITGKKIRSDINLRDEGNAQHIDNPWQADTFNIENISESAETDWAFATSNVSFNEIELGMNQGPEQIHDLMQSKTENAVREFADEIQPQLVLSPTSAGDKRNISGLSAWLPLGTDGSTGDWNAYSGIYNDGAGTTFNAGGISSAAGVANNERWASYYADHDGQLGDNLLDLIDAAVLDCGFSNPIHPEQVGTATSWSGYKFITNRNVMLNIRTLLRKADDNLRSLEQYQGRSLYNGIVMMYHPTLNTANTTLYGTDPFWGVNMDVLKVYTLRGWKFKKKGPRESDLQHNTIRVFWDLVYNIHTRDRRRAGFLISQQ